MKPKKKQVNTVAQRKAERAAQEKRMKRIMWITGACIVVLVLLLVFIRPQSKEASFDYSSLPVLGNPEAPIKIVEMGDYKCPACQYFSQDIEPSLQKDFIDSGKAALYFMNYLIISPNADSNTAALAAQSVFHQNKDEFWKYYHVLFDNQQDEKTEWATPEFLVKLARDNNIKVDYDQLSKDIEEKTYQDEVDSHMATGNKLRVNSTPTLYVNGEKVAENVTLDYNALKSYLDKKSADTDK
ncbi:thioredoxin domain-containing protein [Paenibacillus cellulositrophicus]|uniref:thioredoxin domain-containing protein n=1 Tax=Paenibacillus TaxID=44249 RepID=UPI00203D7C3E|nr:DsbA family protein [Paenibacillus cellulositrophicus]